MKYIAITYGTEGDARPLAALYRALIDAGHEAMLLADAATLCSAHALGVPTTALAGDIKGALQPGGGISPEVMASPPPRRRWHASPMPIASRGCGQRWMSPRPAQAAMR